MKRRRAFAANVQIAERRTLTAGLAHESTRQEKAEPGLWLEDVPVPSVGINDVLIQVHKTAICGTDVHIYKWDAWAQKTIPVPMVVGHEFVGRDRGGRVQRHRLPSRRHRERRRTRGLRALPQLPRRTPPSLRAHPGHRRQSARLLSPSICAADDQRLACTTRVRRSGCGRRSSIRSATRCTRRCRSTCWAKTC